MSKTTPLPKYPLVWVDWYDSFGCSSNWGEIHDALETTKPALCHSVGWLVHDGDDCKVIIPHIAPPHGPDDNEHGCGDMTIPCAAIAQMWVLTATGDDT